MHGKQNIKFCCDNGHAVAQAVGYSVAFHLRLLPSAAGSLGGHTAQSSEEYIQLLLHVSFRIGFLLCVL